MKSAAVRLMLLGVNRFRACGMRSSSFFGLVPGAAAAPGGEGERLERRDLEALFLLIEGWDVSADVEEKGGRSGLQRR